jgi:hypothetical protein
MYRSWRGILSSNGGKSHGLPEAIHRLDAGNTETISGFSVFSVGALLRWLTCYTMFQPEVPGGTGLNASEADVKEAVVLPKEDVKGCPQAEVQPC